MATNWYDSTLYDSSKFKMILYIWAIFLKGRARTPKITYDINPIAYVTMA